MRLPCDEWKASGLKTAEFCRKNQLPLKSFRYWCKQYPKTKENKGFAPVALTAKITQTLNDLSLNIGMRLPNQIQFQLNLSVKQFVELLRGINDGIATIR